ncbi:helix-turn-helix domain-containing protein [Modicisalibacter luteus]|uniref:Helix-turn-helix domain-containing protein n=1 Tax=Modicisalibacter luteus TaxID=453962 RepID=A0ABV7M4W0_9GAMM|nr:AraC family transcriptional regulator [Halomonas lutea]GHA87188.1 AraC family transcriptional regulator [Halomonas lutea]
MKPQYEHVGIDRGCSIRVFHRRLERIPFEWHRHPEYELTLTCNSRGQRFVGDHIGEYDDQDLVLVPPDLPHSWCSSGRKAMDQPHEAVVIWFGRDWVENLAVLCPEYAPLVRLLACATSGLLFNADGVRSMLAHKADLLSDDSLRRLSATLAVLAELAHSSYSVLGGRERLVAQDTAPKRLRRILDILAERYREPISIDTLSEVANLSPRSLHRLFTRHMGIGVRDYLVELRLREACILLVESDWPVYVIAEQAGFLNLSNFNRCFRQRRGMTPRDYRRGFLAGGCYRSEASTVTQRPFSLEYGLDRGNQRKGYGHAEVRSMPRKC